MSKAMRNFLMMSTIMAGTSDIYDTGDWRDVHRSTPTQRAHSKKIANDRQSEARGLKLFNIDGVEVWAINKKNAIRKAKR